MASMRPLRLFFRHAPQPRVRDTKTARGTFEPKDRFLTKDNDGFS